MLFVVYGYLNFKILGRGELKSRPVKNIIYLYYLLSYIET